MSAVHIASAQAVKFKLPIVGKNNGAGLDTLWYGVHPLSTFCLDPFLVTGFSDGGSVTEYELPPLPPTDVFDIRYTNSRGLSDDCFGQGLKLNIQKFTDTTQIDTFQINVQPGSGGYPITFSWPSTFRFYCDSMRFKDPFGILPPPLGINADMLTSTSITITNTAFASFKIFMYGPKVPPPAPDAPTLNGPSNGSVDQPLTATFSWTASTGLTAPINYRLQIATDSNFTSGIFFSGIVTATSKQLTDFDQNTTYYWRVSQTDSFGTSVYQTTPFRFSTILFAPVAANLVSPADAATGVPTTTIFKWNAMRHVDTYQLQVSTDPSFSTTVFDNSTLTDSFRQVTSLENCVTHYWHVRAKNAAGTGPYSGTFSFTVALKIPSIPTLGSPADGATDVVASPVLSWTGDACSAMFHYQLASDTGFTNILASDSTTGLSTTVGPLHGERDYYWRVKASNTPGASPYTTRRKFTTGVFVPAVPALVGPAEGAVVGTTPTLSWNRPINNPTSYHVQVDTTPSFSTPVFDNAAVADTFVRISPISSCDTYYWRVNAGNTAGSSTYSASRSFSTARVVPSAPTLLSPADLAENIGEFPTLSWKGDLCTQDFILQLATSATFDSLIVNDTLAQTSRQVGSLGPALTYYWRVFSRNELGTGPSAMFRFKTTALTTPSVPTLHSPANNRVKVELSPTLTWNVAPRTAFYHLQVAFDQNFDTMMVDDSMLTTNSRQLNDLPNGKSFYWHVNARNDSGTSEYSATWKFSTLAPPAGPYLVSPSNSASGVSVAPTLVWSLPDAADSFQLQVAKDPDFTVALFNKSDLAVTSWQVFNLDGNTQYYWHVRGRNDAGIGAYSSTSSFTTSLWGVANWVIPLSVSESGSAHDTVYFGVNPLASYGIDPVVGEYELPPVPPTGFFDVRFVDVPNRPGTLGEGLRINLLPFLSYSQIDTFKIQFQPGAGTYPMDISWPMNFIKVICDSMLLVDEFGGVNVRQRMDLNSSASVSNLSVSSLVIIMWGAKPLPTDVKPIVSELPKGFVLYQNYPNPFNPSTRIDFSTERFARIFVTVFDVLGREVALLVNGSYFPGHYSVVWNGEDEQGITMNSGVYYVRMRAQALDGQNADGDSYTISKKMMILK